MKSGGVVVGILLTLLVHAALFVFLLYAQPDGRDGGPPQRLSMRAGPSGPFGYGLCSARRRCPLPESRGFRRQPEPPPLDEMEVLEAALMPALGRAKADPRKLPKLQTYEQPEVFEDGVNLDVENPPPMKDLVKDFDPRDAQRDPKSQDKLEDLLQDFREDDPRRKATKLDHIIGHADGVVGGQGDVKRAGNIYGAKVARKLRSRFVVPPFLDEDTLRKLKVRVVVERMNADGEILRYEVKKKSNNRAFDDASIAAIRDFVPKEGGSKTLPRPDPEVLRYINSKGMKIDLDGKLLTR